MARGPKDWHPRGEAVGAQKRAAAFEKDVRRAFVKIYGLPSDPTNVKRSIRSSFLEGERLGWTEPKEGTVLVLTEFGWVRDPWSESGDDHLKWEKVVGLLKDWGWSHPWWDSINPAVQVVYVD